jgi:MFS transporter, NNP family, nitrate/nitrite transporter
VIKKATGSASIGFLIFADLALVALGGVTLVKSRWRSTWGTALSNVKI